MRPSRCCGLVMNWDRRRSMATWACGWCSTDYTASGSAKQPDWTQHPLLNNNGDPDFVAKYGTGAWLPNHFEDSYQDVLPSLNLRLKLNPEAAAAICGFQGDRAAEPGSAHGERLVGR